MPKRTLPKRTLPKRTRGWARWGWARCLLVALTAVAFGWCVPAGSVKAAPKSDLPKRYQAAPFSLMSLSIGYPNNGRQLRAKRLRNTPELKVRKDCVANSYGHPALVLMLKRTARDIAQASRGSVMLVGDLSRENGGQLYGHRSHQSGRDADVGFFVTNTKGQPLVADRFYSFKSDGTARDGSPVLFDDWRNWLLVKSWMLDRRAGIKHIFVHRDLRQRLLRYAAKHPRAVKYVQQAAAFMKQPERTGDHADHFHVRIACPDGQADLCHNESN